MRARTRECVRVFDIELFARSCASLSVRLRYAAARRASATPTTTSATTPLPAASSQIKGELAYLQHHLTVCYEPGDKLTSFAQFAAAVPPCARRTTDPVSNLLGTVVDVKANPEAASNASAPSVFVLETHPP